ncbi:MAG TPA: energy transducer TonB [Pyrinomonadaceae bacterium]|jgi:TonB family protein
MTNNRKNNIPLLIALLFLTVSALTTSIVSSQSSRAITVNERSLRKMATRTVMPTFPEEAKKHGAKGVAVAELEFDDKGAVAQVEVLEAPDPLIKQSVIDAVKQWKFSPTTANENPVNVRGKLTFYYVIDERGEGRVENPKQFN